MYELLTIWGGGSELEDWHRNSTPGKQPYTHLWCDTATNYLLVGIYGHGPGTGVEAFNSLNDVPQLFNSIDTYLYWDSDSNRYTLGAAL